MHDLSPEGCAAHPLDGCSPSVCGPCHVSLWHCLHEATCVAPFTSDHHLCHPVLTFACPRIEIVPIIPLHRSSCQTGCLLTWHPAPSPSRCPSSSPLPSASVCPSASTPCWTSASYWPSCSPTSMQRALVRKGGGGGRGNAARPGPCLLILTSLNTS